MIKGDSQLAITAAKKMYAGTKPNKVTHHWRLAKVTERIAEQLGWLKGLVFQAIRRKANTVADHLANVGIEHLTVIWDSCWQDVNCPNLKEDCTRLSRHDLLNES